MDGNNINKELFQKENFDIKTTINNNLSSNIFSESDLVSFKLKILQREFGNEIDLNMNNLLKFSKTLQSDIKQSGYFTNLLISSLPENKLKSNDKTI